MEDGGRKGNGALPAWGRGGDGVGNSPEVTVNEAGAKAEQRAEAIDAARDRFKVNISGICGRCSHAHLWRTTRMTEPVVKCNSLDERVPTDVVECSNFKQIGVLGVWELAQLCLDIDLSKGTKRVGFGKDE